MKLDTKNEALVKLRTFLLRFFLSSKDTRATDVKRRVLRLAGRFTRIRESMRIGESVKRKCI